MHYPDSKDRSAELLRLAIPMMAQQPAPLHPITYAVWYDYLAGRNADLRGSQRLRTRSKVSGQHLCDAAGSGTESDGDGR